ncbi:hypothetical protein CSKR_110706 [Clonorchis sinensis]|uniref:Uncharacterized protein n=1 Tax=Clonorchis sinensis TaxID=79923 RepID=A0A3R7EQC2_CLOSI|nr:hypothetical protein CSKR_110706 [Clonorchis sinensis]
MQRLGSNHEPAAHKSEEHVSTDRGVLCTRGQLGPLSWRVSKQVSTYQVNPQRSREPINRTRTQSATQVTRQIDGGTDTHTHKLSDTPKQLLHMNVAKDYVVAQHDTCRPHLRRQRVHKESLNLTMLSHHFLE